MESGQLLVDVTGLEIVTERVEIERGSGIDISNRLVELLQHQWRSDVVGEV